MLKRIVNSIYLISLFFLVNGCTTTISFKDCGIQPLNRLVARVNTPRFEYKDIESVVLNLDKVSKSIKKDLECLVLQEYNEGKSEKLKLLTVHILNEDITLHYGFIYDQEVLVEVQYIPMEGGIAFLTNFITPMTNVIKSFGKEGRDKLPTALLGQDQGLLTKDEFLVFINDLTNGLFSNKSKE